MDGLVFLVWRFRAFTAFSRVLGVSPFPGVSLHSNGLFLAQFQLVEFIAQRPNTNAQHLSGVCSISVRFAERVQNIFALDLFQRNDVFREHYPGAVAVDGGGRFGRLASTPPNFRPVASYEAGRASMVASNGGTTREVSGSPRIGGWFRRAFSRRATAGSYMPGEAE
jgi:hypothetical protein